MAFNSSHLFTINGSFSGEMSSGTLELLITKPLNPSEIFVGKFLGLAFVFCACIFMTTLNIVALNSLLTFESELDMSSYLLPILVISHWSCFYKY